MKRKCEICGKEYKIRPAIIKMGMGKYCSRECGGIARSQKISMKCEVCGKPMSLAPSRLKNGYGKYCSIVCRGLSIRGRISPMKGKKHSEETLKLMRERTPWNKDLKGIHLSPNTEWKKGQSAWNKGIPFSEEVRVKMSANKQNEKNFNWKGDDAKYGTKHDWIRTKMGRARDGICEICGEKQAMDWSNKDHKYKRRIEDWQRVCRKCHHQYDKKLN